MEINVAFISKKLKEQFETLKKGKSEDKQLYKFIDRALGDIKTDVTCGVKIPKKLWPKSYIQDYRLTNLWKYNLPGAWRLIYTVESDEVKIIGIILEWFSHKEYEQKFKY